MSSGKPISGLLTVHDKDGNVFIQNTNISFRFQARYRAIYQWNNNSDLGGPVVITYPWKMTSLLVDDDILIGHGGFHAAAGAVYPADPTGSSVVMTIFDYNHYRWAGTVGTVPAANIPRVFGTVAGVSVYPGTINHEFGRGDGVISQVDVPIDYTQIGIVYFHPAHMQSQTVSTTVGQNFITYTNAQFWDNYYIHPGILSIVRIETGADAGYYFVQNNDFTNNRLYLMCLDGTPFKANATASGLTATAAPGRRAWFNEVSIIPLSVGTLDTSGRYNPRNPAAPFYGDPALRESYIMRLVIEKTGSTEAESGTEKQGSYLMSLRPFTHGDGSLGSAIPDDRSIAEGWISSTTGGSPIPAWFNHFSGGVNGMVLDWDNQRLWFGYTNSSNQSGIAHWRWKTSEGFREIANYLGTAVSAAYVTPSIVLGAGDVITDLEMGSNHGSSKNWVYCTIFHASGGNAGVAIIKPDLTTLQYNTGSGVPASVLAGCSLDKSRTRTGTAGDTSTNGADQITSASGAFTAADIGRAIKLTGLGADNGTYKIATIVGGTQVTVTTLAGGGVTFTNQTGGTFEIGDRLYLFFNNGTTGAGQINYMESMSPGTFLTRSVTMTNGANINTRVTGGTGQVFGQREMCHVDQATGNIYWLSNDTQQQINKYDVTANSHAFIAISNTSLLSPAGGVVVGGTTPATNPATPTIFTAIWVNSKFDDIWVGSDQGHFRIAKSTFAAASIRRYFGSDTTTYVSGTPYTTGTGNGTTGIAGTAPNMLLNATGTPFVASDVGKYVVITGATAAGNHGAFLITAVNSSSQISYTNASGVAQANYAGTFYLVPSFFQRSDGGLQASSGNSRHVRTYYEGLDGKVYGYSRNNVTSNGNGYYFSQEAEAFYYKGDNNAQNSNEATWSMYFQDGHWFYMHPSAGGGSSRWLIGVYEIEHQWDNANTKWIPKEWVRTSMPNKSISDTTNTGTLARPIHSTFQDVMFGVKVRWNRQGGATPANNEFLGRGGQTRTTTTDGSTTLGSSTFGGSSFTAGDVGNLLRIETGADAGIYKITAFISAASVTLTRMNGTTYAALATASSLTYTVWAMGTPGSNAGPENITFVLGDGFTKDNTQDISGITYESFGWKTRVFEQTEARKFAIENPLAVPGSLDTKVYYETYARATPQYDAALSHHRALPGAEVTNGRQLCDWFQDKFLNNTGAKADLYSSPANTTDWHGIQANSSVLGCSPMVDLGKDVEVGYVVIRFHGYEGTGYSYKMLNLTFHGLIANVYKALDAGGTPVASSSIRTSGTTNINVSGANVTTVTVSSGDFLGAITTGPLSNGAITTGQSTFVAPAATFVASDRMKALKITAGASGDNGSYRIIAVSLDGSTVTIRNLDQTTKQWTVTASSITYEVRDAVREEDMVAIPSLASPTHRLCVERLLSATSFQARTAANATVTNQNWQCVVPTWDHVKRLSPSTEALPPDFKNNGTWISGNGRNNYDLVDAICYFDLSDLPTAQRTGRWWKWTGIPRGNSDSGQDVGFNFTTFEFYDTSGNKLGVSKYTQNDRLINDPDYYFNWINRADWIQSADDALAGVAGFNGNAGLAGANGDTITPTTGGNKFLGFQIGPLLTDGNLPSGTNQINSAGSSFPASAILGRFIRITTGANAGNFYRVATRPSATQITVTTPSGGAVSWAGTESSIQFSMHEGINMGGTAPDKFVFTEDQREFTILTINDALTTITISETLQPSRSNKTWEIRRPCYDTASTTTEAAKTGRLTRPQSTYPVQSGDICHDSRGHHRLFSEDIGTGFQRADGVIAGGSGAFTGTSFTSSDVGRLLYITTGVNRGIYEISVFTSATSITVKNHYTGAAVSLTADAGPVTYQIFGNRRFRLSKYIVGLRA